MVFLRNLDQEMRATNKDQRIPAEWFMEDPSSSRFPWRYRVVPDMVLPQNRWCIKNGKSMNMNDFRVPNFPENSIWLVLTGLDYT